MATNALHKVTVSIDQRRTRLFDGFVDAMFVRRAKVSRCNKGQAIKWLSHLAGSLSRRDQTVFSLEQLRMDVLFDPLRQQIATALILVTLLTLMVALVPLVTSGALFFGAGLSFVGWGSIVAATMIGVGCFGGGLLSTLVDIKPVSVIRFSVKENRSFIQSGAPNWPRKRDGLCAVVRRDHRFSSLGLGRQSFEGTPFSFFDWTHWGWDLWCPRIPVRERDD